MRIDDILTLPDRVLPSPMEGVMAPIFCRAAMELDLVHTWMTPFVSVSRASVPAAKVFQKHIVPFRNDYPLIVQLLGHDPEPLVESTRILRAVGVRAINLNLACPSGKVLSSGNGGACLKDPVRITELCLAIKESVPDISPSVKIRTGWESPREMENIIDAVRNAGIPFAVCHFRTVSEGYAPIPGEEGIRRIREVVEYAGKDILLFGNGDILNPDDAWRMINETSCAGVAVGRGFLRDPFLLKKLRTPDSLPAIDNKIVFLKKIYEIAKLEGLGPKWRKSAFTEYARMTFGVNSEIFRKMLDMDDSELELFLDSASNIPENTD